MKKSIALVLGVVGAFALTTSVFAANGTMMNGSTSSSTMAGANSKCSNLSSNSTTSGSTMTGASSKCSKLSTNSTTSSSTMMGANSKCSKSK